MTIDSVAHRLQQWKRQLIDLTRRNPLLNFRAYKASTVEIVDEKPQLVLRDLLDGMSFEFDPKPEEEADESDEEAQEPSPPARDLSKGQALTAVDEDELEEHHEDDRLQTALPKKRLSRNLVNIHRRAETSLEETGVNTLFLAIGMLEWHEADDSSRSGRAPLIMVPVQLKRRTAASSFKLSLGDEEPMLNLAIVEKLRLDFRIDLPELPELTNDLDIDEVFDGIREKVSGFHRWRLTSDMALGLFSFQKFIMYRDIERHEERLREHPVIQAICGEGEEQELTGGLPPEIAEADLDEELPPWTTPLVMNADSSQQRAILAVKKGHHLVIEGPPGTGKSQTITNLIADALHDGKTVLFVAEKQAALDVVHSRLEHDAGLVDHVLELHSNKASKKEFVDSIADSLDRFEEGSTGDQEELRRLERVADELQGYVTELHTPVGPLGMSPYNAIASFAAVEEAPAISGEIEAPADVTAEQFEEAKRLLTDLTRTLGEISDPRSHPLRGIGVEHAGRKDREPIADALEAAGTALSDLTVRAEEIADSFGFRTARSLGDAQVMVEGGRTVARSPGAEVSVLENSAWNEMPAGVDELLETGERFTETREAVRDHLRPEVLDEDLSQEIDEYDAFLDKGIWRFFVPGYWKVRGQLRGFLTSGYRPDSASGFLHDLRTAQRCRAARAEIRDADERGQTLFGQRWKGPGSDWEDLRSFSDWVVDFRKYVLKETVGGKGLRVAAESDFDVDEADRKIRTLASALKDVRNSFESLANATKLDEGSDLAVTAESRIGRLAHRVGQMETNLDALRPYSAFVAARRACERTIARNYVGQALDIGLGAGEIIPAFERWFFDLWLSAVFTDKPTLERFHPAEHEGRIESFRRLDRKSLELGRDRVLARLGAQRQDLLSSDLRGQLQLLQREAKKKSRILPVRKLMRHAGKAIQKVKPCFMMSPISAAQYLDAEFLHFDLVVFDEASQIPPPDAIGAIMRADQVVVVGDSKQLPPTQFFDVDKEDDEAEGGLDTLLLEDLESILDEVSTAGIPSLRLKWHYRSEHQSLIRFSNEEFYSDEPLYVFPAATAEAPDLGLKFKYLGDAAYEGRGKNPVEARYVAEAVVEHIQTTPALSLGVGTFGKAQQMVVLDEVDRLRRENPSIEWFFNQEGEKKFFVKNLENIQGDDRDVILLSVTYGPDPSGVIRRNFGPINQKGGWRRLNVLTTRAKRLLRVFSSMRGDEIDTSGIAEGAVLLQKYLKYAETGEYPATRISEGPAEGPFETAVVRALERRGYRTVTQVGDAGYRIDIGIIDQKLPGSYLCGVECDGATYHSAATVRDRDRLRQQVLELRGWTIHRVWSTDWFHDAKGQIERLVKLIERTRIEKEGKAKRPTPITRPEPPPGRSGPATDNGQDSGDGSEEPRTALEDIPVPEYQFAPTSPIGEPEAFYTTPTSDVARVARAIIDIEGPIHVHELARRVAACWEMRQAGNQIRRKVSEALGLLSREGTITQEDDFVWMDTEAPIPVRSRDLEGVTFSSDTVAPCEVVAAIRLLLQHRSPLLPEEIIRETARVLGFARTGKKLAERIETAKEALIAQGELRPGGRGIWLVQEADEGEGEEPERGPSFEL